MFAVCALLSARAALDPAMEEMMAGLDPELRDKISVMDADSMMGGGGGAPAPPAAPAVARKEEVPFVVCGVCREAVKQLSRQGAEAGALGEVEAGELAEQICDPETAAGAWIKGTRLKAKGGALSLVPDIDKESCKEDCATIRRACDESFADASLDAAEALYNGAKRAALTELVCNELSDACAAKPPPLPDDHWRYRAQQQQKKKRKRKGARSADL